MFISSKNGTSGCVAVPFLMRKPFACSSPAAARGAQGGGVPEAHVACRAGQGPAARLCVRAVLTSAVKSAGYLWLPCGKPCRAQEVFCRGWAWLKSTASSGLQSSCLSAPSLLPEETCFSSTGNLVLWPGSGLQGKEEPYSRPLAFGFLVSRWGFFGQPGASSLSC